MATEAKTKTVANDMPQRQIFATREDMETYLATAAETYSDFAEVPFASPAMETNDDGEIVGFSEHWDGEGLAYMVSVLKNKGTKDSPSTVKAVVAAPIPTVEALIANDSGAVFLRAIVEKELNHRAVRQLREAEDVSTVADQIPFTLEGFISSSRESSGILESFNELYKSISDTLAAARPQWKKARLTKGELKKALESKGYALEYYAPLEEHGKDGSLFVAALNLGVKAAKRQGLDPTIFERWAETRDARGFDNSDDDEEELDLDSMADAMLAEEEKAAAEEAADASDSTESDEAPAAA